MRSSGTIMGDTSGEMSRRGPFSGAVRLSMHVGWWERGPSRGPRKHARFRGKWKTRTLWGNLGVTTSWESGL